MGQLLVVARHTDTSPSSCYEPELIPDPLCSIARHNDVDQVAMDLGSGVVAVGLSPTITRVAIPCRNGRVSGTRKIPACVAQQLIPDLSSGNSSGYSRCPPVNVLRSGIRNYEQSLIALRPVYTMQRGLLIRVLK